VKFVQGTNPGEANPFDRHSKLRSAVTEATSAMLTATASCTLDTFGRSLAISYQA
jgi:hypothetical protein